MRGTNRSLMRAQQPPFQQKRDAISQRQEIVSKGGFLSDNLVGVSASLQAVVAAPSVGAHGAPRGNHALDSCFQRRAGGVCNPPQTDTTDPRAILLRRDQNQHLSCRSAAAFSGLRTTQKSLIDFHGSCSTWSSWLTALKPHPSEPVARNTP